ncbi:TPA: TraY domain-containing protein [Legionella pneumophila]
METKLESNNNYRKVHITIQLSEDANRLLSQSCSRSNRKKIQEATLRLEDHLKKFRSISELNYAIPLNEGTE